MNNDYSKKKTHWFSIDRKERQMCYNQKGHIDESRFVDDDIAEIHNLLKSDYIASLMNFSFNITHLI